MRAVGFSLLGLSAVSLVVASGTASPVVYGVGEATPAVAATGLISSLIAILTGSGGVWALLKTVAPHSAKYIELLKPVADVVKPVISDVGVKDTAMRFVEEIFGGTLDASTLTEEGALLFVGVCRLKAGDRDGKDKTFELLEHIRELSKQTKK
jgi:hypothetical protein